MQSTTNSRYCEDELPFPPEEIADWELRHGRRRGDQSSYRHQRHRQFYPLYIDRASTQGCARR